MILSDAQAKSDLRRHRIKVFVLTFLTQVALYSTRTAWSYSKMFFQNTMGVTSETLGTLDMLFLLCYSFSMAVISNVTQYINIKYFLFCGVCPAAVAFLSIALMGFVDAHSLLGISLALAFYGLLQAVNYPCLVAIMRNWFGRDGRGFVMGLWSSNTNIGNIIGLQICHTVIITLQWQWEYCVAITACLLILVTVADFKYLEPYPEKIGFDIAAIDAGARHQHEQPQSQRQQAQQHAQAPERAGNVACFVAEDAPRGCLDAAIAPAAAESARGHATLVKDEEECLNPDKQSLVERKRASSGADGANDTQAGSKKLNALKILRAPGIAYLAIAYASLKSVNYGLSFWLPKYLDDLGLQASVASLAQMLQVGTFCGAIFVGMTTDRVGKRTIVLAPMLLISALCMWYTSVADVRFAQHLYVLFFVIGFTFGGPYAQMGSTISMDLSEMPALADNKHSLMTIISTIEGASVLVAAVMQKVIPLAGTARFFYTLAALCAVASAFLAPLVAKDGRELAAKWGTKMPFFGARASSPHKGGAGGRKSEV